MNPRFLEKPVHAAHDSVFLLLEQKQEKTFSAPLAEPREPFRKGRPLGKEGGLAQLVERLLCKQNVNGSNPLTSTIFGIEY